MWLENRELWKAGVEFHYVRLAHLSNVDDT